MEVGVPGITFRPALFCSFELGMLLGHTTVNIIIYYTDPHPLALMYIAGILPPVQHLPLEITV